LCAHQLNPVFSGGKSDRQETRISSWGNQWGNSSTGRGLARRAVPKFPIVKDLRRDGHRYGILRIGTTTPPRIGLTSLPMSLPKSRSAFQVALGPRPRGCGLIAQLFLLHSRSEGLILWAPGTISAFEDDAASAAERRSALSSSPNYRSAPSSAAGRWAGLTALGASMRHRPGKRGGAGELSCRKIVMR
jgi:hypothetical protein